MVGNTTHKHVLCMSTAVTSMSRLYKGGDGGGMGVGALPYTPVTATTGLLRHVQVLVPPNWGSDRFQYPAPKNGLEYSHSYD